jgi:hypothetical protein
LVERFFTIKKLEKLSEGGDPETSRSLGASSVPQAKGHLENEFVMIGKKILHYQIIAELGRGGTPHFRGAAGKGSGTS